MSTTNDPIEIKPYTTNDLAEIYHVKCRTMRNWLLPHSAAIGKKIGHLYTTRQVRIIFEKLGLPGTAQD